MLHVFYNLFMACCMFTLSTCGLVFVMALWRKSNTICDKCRKEMKND